MRTHFGTGMCHTDIATRVTLLRKLTGEEIVEFGTEDTVSDELALFADLARHFWVLENELEKNKQVSASNCRWLSEVIQRHPSVSCDFRPQNIRPEDGQRHIEEYTNLEGAGFCECRRRGS